MKTCLLTCAPYVDNLYEMSYPGKSKKNMNLSSAEIAQEAVKVNSL